MTTIAPTSQQIQPRAKLNTGAEIPLVGLGTWKSKSDEVTNAVFDALQAGFRVGEL